MHYLSLIDHSIKRRWYNWTEEIQWNFREEFLIKETHLLGRMQEKLPTLSDQIM